MLLKLTVNLNKILCLEKLFLSESLQGGCFSLSLYLKAWSVTLDKAYVIITTNDLHQTETPNLGKSPSVGFKKPDSLPDKITAREYRKLTQLSDLYNSAESDWSLETYTMSHFLT